jgi:GMP synthase-like glutamine amidotransferase
MHPVLIFRHVHCEGPGYLADFLKARNIPMELVRIDRADPVPTHVDACSGLAFMGGTMSVNDPLPWIEPELALIRLAHSQGIPVLGHCLGGQLISKALGGEVVPNPVPEIGWHPVERIDSGARWLNGLPPRFEVFHWHGETFSIPKGATPLLRSPYCEDQAFAIGNTLALQCHVEMTVELVQEWVDRYRDQILAPSVSLQGAAEILDRLPERISALQEVADQIYTCWLDRF